jgi:small-conductance mechanosensitive channel
MSDYALVVRVIADTKPSKRFDVERTLRERISRGLAEDGIKVPLPPAGTRQQVNDPGAGL